MPPSDDAALRACVEALERGKCVPVTLKLQRQALAAIEMPEGYADHLTDDALKFGVQAEGLHLCKGNGSQVEQAYLVVLALAHVEWDKQNRFAVGLSEILALFVRDKFEVTMTRLKRAHTALDTRLVKHRKICVFCAPTHDGFVHGQVARSGDKVLQTLRESGLLMNGARYIADGQRFEIDEGTTFGSVCNARRAVGLRRFISRARAPRTLECPE